MQQHEIIKFGKIAVETFLRNFFKTGSKFDVPFNAKYNFSCVEDYYNERHKIKFNSLYAISDNPSQLNNLRIKNGLFVASGLFHNEIGFVIFISKNNNSDFFYNIPAKTFEKPKKFSVSFVCSEDSPYRHQLIKAVRYYYEMIDGIDIAVAYFGDNPPNEINGKCNLKKFDYDVFNMAYARNRSIELCKENYIFITDIDKRFSINTINYIKKSFSTIPNENVFIITDPGGPYDYANIFGHKKTILDSGGYYEKIKGVYFEDSEILINFSRKNLGPVFLIVDYQRERNSISKRVNQYQNQNEHLFSRMLKYGSRP